MLNDIKELLARDSFVAFKIVPTSGGAYEVVTPYEVAVGETQLNYYYPRSDRWAILRQNQITAFEVTEDTHK